MTQVMRATTAALAKLAGTGDLNPRSLASGEALRARLHPSRQDALPPLWLRARYDVESTTQYGATVIEVTPRNGSGLEVVYLHGGAYVSPLHPAHWLIIDAIVKHTGARIHIPFYALAPEAVAAEALPPVDALVDRLRASGSPVAVAGDSAGGGMALVQALRVRDAGGPQLASVLLLSPWLDITMPSSESRTIEPSDVLLRCEGLIAGGRWWAGAWETSDWRVSPARANLAGLPPITVLQGGRDIFLPDVKQFDAAVKQAGGDIFTAIFPDGFHVFAAAVWTPEARQAWRLAAERLLEHAGNSPRGELPAHA